MRQKGTIFYNTLLLTGINLLLRGLTMTFSVYLSRRIGAEGLGLFQLIGTVGGLAMTFGLSGARVSAMYLCAEEYGLRRYDGVRQAMRCCLIYGAAVSILAGIALFLFAGRISLSWIGDAQAADSLRILALFLPVNCLCSILGGYYTACDRIRELVGIEIGERLLSLLLTLLLLRYAGSSRSACCAAVILGGNLAGLAAAAVMFFRFFRENREHKKTAEKLNMPRRLFRLAVPLALSDYLRSALNALEQFLIPWGLALYTGSQNESMAAYGVIHGMVFPILMFPAAVLYSLSDLMVPELARRKATGNQRRIRQLTKRCLQMGTVFASAVCGLMYVLSDALAELVYQNSAVAGYLRTFAPMILILYLDAIVDGMEKGLGQQVATVRFNTITSFLDVVFLFILLPKFGIGGYLFTFVLTHLINFWLSLRRLLKVTEYEPDLMTALRCIVSTLVAITAAYLLPVRTAAEILLVRGSGFLLVFLLLTRATRAVTGNDLLWLCGILRPGRNIDKQAEKT